MNQTRTFLLFALLAVAYFLWMDWQQDYSPHPPAQAASAAAHGDTGTPSINNGTVPTVDGGQPADNTIATHEGSLVTIRTDLLQLVLDTHGGNIVRSSLLNFPAAAPTRQHPDPGPTPLLSDTPSDLYLAQSGLVSQSGAGAAPDHHAQFQAGQTSYQLAPGQDSLTVELNWQDPASGLKVMKSYTLHRGSYVVDYRQSIHNDGTKPWQGNAYEQLQRVAPLSSPNWWQSITDPSSRSFFGAAWYSPDEKFETLDFKDFAKHPLNRVIGGGWISMQQHYFFAAWIPPARESDSYATAEVDVGGGRPSYIIRTISPVIRVAPGQSGERDARIYIGPKLLGSLDSIAPGLDLTTNYGWFTLVAEPLHWLLSHIHHLCGNWGVAIILLVLLIKLVIWKLTAMQFRSGAMMRKLQPRIEALKERYGDDKMKLQQAMMELYKKEKINPMAGCLPLLVTFPVFIGLYRVLSESVELRQAPFFGWIHDLSAPDPYFILPVIYVLILLATQWLTPPPAGMDPTQAKMMKFMPIMFAVIMAFFPSGLVLYWIINSGTGLIQQWLITREVDRAGAKGHIA